MNTYNNCIHMKCCYNKMCVLRGSILRDLNSMHTKYIHWNIVLNVKYDWYNVRLVNTIDDTTIENISEMTGASLWAVFAFFSPVCLFLYNYIVFTLYNIRDGKNGLKSQSEKVMRSCRVKHIILFFFRMPISRNIFVCACVYNFTFCEWKRFGSWPKKAFPF